MKKKVLVVGASGKMGSAVCEVLKNDYDIKLNRSDEWANFSADLIIDFACAESSVLSAEMASKMRVPLIVGSTGQTIEQLKKIRELCVHIPFMICSNFSVGMALLKSCINQVLKFEIDDICIFEKHHKNKKDSPSGTALSLFKFIKKRCDKKVDILAERGGEEIGTHKIDFYFASELIEISHVAFSRKAFADGVKLAVDFMLQNEMISEICFEEVLAKKFNIFCE